jgi:hypothetical protein
MPQTRDQVFDRIQVDYLVRGTSRISWSLRPRFADALPHEYQLQANRAGGDPDQWEDVGDPVSDSFFALDDQVRLRGQDRNLVYRVVLTTPAAVYTSPHADILGKMEKRQWLQAREIIRQLSLDQRGLVSLSGLILKRKTAGTPCPRCRDRLTGGIRDARCPTCHGTGWTDGYWRAFASSMIDLGPAPRFPNNRNNTATTDQPVTIGRFIGFPYLQTRDVWVDANADRRYFLHKLQNTAEMNLVPLVVDAELHEAEHSDPIYDVPLA